MTGTKISIESNSLKEKKQNREQEKKITQRFRFKYSKICRHNQLQQMRCPGCSSPTQWLTQFNPLLHFNTGAILRLLPHGAVSALRVRLNRIIHLRSSITQGNQADSKHCTQIHPQTSAFPGSMSNPQLPAPKGRVHCKHSVIHPG